MSKESLAEEANLLSNYVCNNELWSVVLELWSPADCKEYYYELWPQIGMQY